MPNLPTFAYQSPDDLLFDSSNPRFGGDLGSKTQGEIQDFIFGKPHYASELVDSLLENGFIDYEPLVVRKNGNKFIVVEGNRRLAAVKHILSNPERFSGKIEDLKSLPVLIFPDKPDPEQASEMSVYLGVRHLFGFREWPPRSKARFLDERIISKETLNQVIRELGVSKQEIRRLLIPYRLLKDASLQLPPDEDFWVLGESLGRTGVKDFLQLDVDSDTLQIRKANKGNLKMLLNDLYGEVVPGKRFVRDRASARVTDTRDLSRYSKVLSSPEARKVIRSGGSLEQAALYVDTTQESVKRLEKLTRDIGVLLGKVLKRTNPEYGSVLARYKLFDRAVKRFLKNAKSDV
jgi:hypothetical protein